MYSLLIQHLVGGEVFFTGTGLLLLALLLACWWPTWRWLRQWLSLLGILCVATSATPFIICFYLCWLVAICWFATTSLASPEPTGSVVSSQDSTAVRTDLKTKQGKFACLAALFTTVLALLWELPYHVAPRINFRPERLIVIGDSISAGLDDSTEDTWPQLLEQATKIEVLNLSRAGATVNETNKTLTQNWNQIPLPPGLVLLEMGGNDVLGGTDLQAFETQLDQLLRQLRTDHDVVMFELP